MKTSQVLPAATAALLLTTTAVMAQAPGSALNLGPVLPAPGWGTTSTYNVYVSQNGRPVKNSSVVFFFSGRHGLESAHLSRNTNAQGIATFSTAIPRSWGNTGTWVNANAISPQLGLQQNWRVKK